ncbi:hypothetical protein [Rhizobium sp. RCC_161_2]
MSLPRLTGRADCELLGGMGSLLRRMSSAVFWPTSYRTMPRAGIAQTNI